MNHKVSIAVPVYNVEKYLQRCIDSILSQTYKNFELILVDDCSTDNSLTICNEYAQKDNRIKVVQKPAHTVLSDVRNVGIENATGKYIMFVDSDDYVCNNFVEEMVNAIEKKQVDVVRCKAIFQKKGTNEIEELYAFADKIYKKDEFDKIIPSFSAFLDTNISCYSWALIINREKLNIRFNNTLFCQQDVVFLLELLTKGINSIYFLDKPLYYYCYNEQGTTYNVDNFDRYVDGIINVTKEKFRILSESNLLDEELTANINYTTFMMVKKKLLSLSAHSLLTIRKKVKYAFEKKEIRETLKDAGKKTKKMKSKFFIFCVKLRLYFMATLYLKLYNKFCY